MRIKQLTKFSTLLLLLAFDCLLSLAPVYSQDVTPMPAGPTVASIRARGEVACGVNQGLFGFGYLDPNTGEIRGFDVDFCRALAAAVLGDIEATRLDLHTVETGEAALLTGELDILLHNVSETLSRDTASALDFGPPNFYNGQTVMVLGDSGLDTWNTLAGRTICTTTGTAAANLAKEMAIQGVVYDEQTFDSVEAAQEAFVTGGCDAHSGDWIQLAALRRESETPLAYVIWEDTFTVEPLVPVYRYGDAQWADIVEWTLYGLIRAEELDITSENVEALATEPTDDAIAQFLGAGATLGLAEGMMVEVIRQVGNYGEIYERNLGASTPMRIPRGLNALWSAGGLMYAPLFDAAPAATDE
jgi:general L-amino acid transport system substrate-binding protein